MNVVLDTNVLVSGIFFKGIPSKIIDAWFNHRFIVWATPAILEEYLRVIDDLICERTPVFEHHWNEVLAEICEMVPDEKAPQRICRDPADDKFILCAIRSGAKYLISGDADLKALPSSFNCNVVSPREFWNILG